MRKDLFTAQDRDLARTVSGYWPGFVRTGVPAAPGQPEWPRIRTDAPLIMQLDVRPAVRPILPATTLAAAQAFLSTGGVPRLF